MGLILKRLCFPLNAIGLEKKILNEIVQLEKKKISTLIFLFFSLQENKLSY